MKMNILTICATFTVLSCGISTTEKEEIYNSAIAAHHAKNEISMYNIKDENEPSNVESLTYNDISSAASFICTSSVKFEDSGQLTSCTLSKDTMLKCEPYSYFQEFLYPKGSILTFEHLDKINWGPCTYKQFSPIQAWIMVLDSSLLFLQLKDLKIYLWDLVHDRLCYQDPVKIHINDTITPLSYQTKDGYSYMIDSREYNTQHIGSNITNLTSVILDESTTEIMISYDICARDRSYTEEVLLSADAMWSLKTILEFHLREQ